MQTEKAQYMKYKIHWIGLTANEHKGIKTNKLEVRLTEITPTKRIENP